MSSEKNDLPVVQDTSTMEMATTSDVGTALINLVNRIGPDSTTAMVEALEKMCDLQIKMDAITAQKNFAAAKARLQAELHSIESLGEMKEGGKVIYKFPTLDQIGRAVKPICDKHGFSFSFEYDVQPVGNKVMATTTFILLHQDGHSERTNFVCEMAEGNKMMREGFQKSGATQTASMRRAMIGGLGLTWCDKDTDDIPEEVETINADELETLDKLIADVYPDPEANKEEIGRFKNWLKSRFGADEYKDIPKSAIPEIFSQLQLKKSKRTK